MNNNEKLIIGGLLGLGIAGLAYLGYQWLKEQEEEDQQEAEAQQPTASKPEKNLTRSKTTSAKAVTKKSDVPSSVAPTRKKGNTESDYINVAQQPVVEKRPPLIFTDDKFPLKLGSKGKNVERLKIWLQRNYGTFGIINDEFNYELEKIVKQRLKKSEVSEIDFKAFRMGKPLHKQPIIR